MLGQGRLCQGRGPASPFPIPPHRSGEGRGMGAGLCNGRPGGRGDSAGREPMEAPLGLAGCSVLGTQKSPRRAHGARGGSTWGWSPGWVGLGAGAADSPRPGRAEGRRPSPGGGPPCPQPLPGSRLGAPQPPCQASSRLPLGAQMEAVLPAARPPGPEPPTRRSLGTRGSSEPAPPLAA